MNASNPLEHIEKSKKFNRAEAIAMRDEIRESHGNMPMVVIRYHQDGHWFVLDKENEEEYHCVWDYAQGFDDPYM